MHYSQINIIKPEFDYNHDKKCQKGPKLDYFAAFQANGDFNLRVSEIRKSLDFRLIFFPVLLSSPRIIPWGALLCHTVPFCCGLLSVNVLCSVVG